MRNEILPPEDDKPTYEIRAIVTIAEELERLGVQVSMENIGDPLAKGEIIPAWMKDIVSSLAREDWTYGYCPTRGLLDTRRFIAERTNSRGGARITPDDIIFFNGLGDAVQKVYGVLRQDARVIVPSPTYTAHSLGEAGHAGRPPLCYRLDPRRAWRPDLEELRLLARYNPCVSGILIVNPDNPTGAVFPEEVLCEIIDVAREHDLFIISDEVYGGLVYNGKATPPISDLVGEVPAIAMKGISKEVPWPGARCGWIEVFNPKGDPVFARYVKKILDAKMVEVCSTTLPQAAIPGILSHPNYSAWIEERRERYERASNIAYDILKDVPGLEVNRTDGAFYMAVAFQDGALRAGQHLPIDNPKVRALVERMVAEPGLSPDKRFVYYLLAATGICVVPLSSFGTSMQGFRVTLLERDEARLTKVFTTLADAVHRYLASEPTER